MYQQHHYYLVHENGDHVMELRSDSTSLDSDTYAQQFIVPMLPALSEAHGERVYFSPVNIGGHPE